MSQILNHKIEGTGSPLLLIHGLFGSLDNLGGLARELKNHYQVISVDLRNHGSSFHSQHHSYQEMAIDLSHLIDYLGLENLVVIGHSMGGKAAMQLASLTPDIVEKLIILDMAPIHYTVNRHENVFAAIEETEAARCTTRRDAMTLLNAKLDVDGVAQFLGKSLAVTDTSNKSEKVMQFKFNTRALKENYAHILGWNEPQPIETPTLFIKGGNSDYILPEHQEAIMRQFPNAKAHVITNTGHWLHAEKPESVLRAILKFLS